MVLGIISFIVIAAAIVGAVVGIYYTIAKTESFNKYYDSEEQIKIAKAKNDKLKRSRVGFIALTIVLTLVLLVVPFSFHTVDVSEVAVVRQLGLIKHTREAGTYFDFWVMNSYTKYDLKVKEITLEDMAYSSDAQQMTLDIKVQYQITPDKVKEIAKNYGSIDVLEARITPVIRDRVKAVLSSKTAMQIIETRESLSADAEIAVEAALGDNYFLSVASVSITNIDFSDQFEAAVEDKMIAEQNQLKAQYENETKVAKAQAEADAKIIAAEAEAKANELKEKSLTDKILQDKYLNKWDGKLPSVVAGENGNLMIPTNYGEE